LATVWLILALLSAGSPLAQAFWFQRIR
jgi:hypothetical protein